MNKCPKTQNVAIFTVVEVTLKFKPKWSFQIILKYELQFISLLLRVDK